MYPRFAAGSGSPHLVGQAFLATAPLNPRGGRDPVQTSAGLSAEIPSGNGTANAHALARAYALLARGGDWTAPAWFLRHRGSLRGQASGGPTRSCARPYRASADCSPRSRPLARLPPQSQDARRAPALRPNSAPLDMDGAGARSPSRPRHKVSVGFVRNELRSDSKFFHPADPRAL